MTFLQLLPLLFVLVGLILYTVLAGADLGTGVWQLSTRDQRLRGRVYASIGPVWEANHVWLIFVLTVLWTRTRACSRRCPSRWWCRCSWPRSG